MLLSSPVIFEGRQKQKRKRLLLGGKRKKKKKNRNPNKMPARGSYEEYMSIRPGLSHNLD